MPAGSIHKKIAEHTPDTANSEMITTAQMIRLENSSYRSKMIEFEIMKKEKL